MKESNQIQYFLYNSYSRYLYEPLALNDTISRVVAAVSIDILSDTYLDLYSESIVPVVRHKEFYCQMVEMGVNGVSIPLNEELVLLFAVDDSLSISI